MNLPTNAAAGIAAPITKKLRRERTRIPSGREWTAEGFGSWAGCAVPLWDHKNSTCYSRLFEMEFENNERTYQRI